MSTSRNPINLFLASAVTASVNALQGRWMRRKIARDTDGDHTPAGKRHRISVAEGKRRARKARNIRRHKLAMKRRGRK